ncbi:MAG: hemolysin [Marinilabiliales bacterium]|nr:MAG: hemolysin [Marinilabiliales bacterium]
MTLLILFLALTLVVSFLCSILEATLLSSSVPYLLKYGEEGRKSAMIMIDYKSNIDKPLTAILSLNTFANTFGAAGVGAQAVEVFGDIYFGLASMLLTFAVLFFSEIIPKTLGANYWKQLVFPAAITLRVIVFISYPLVLIAKFLTSFLAKKDNQSTVSREEVAAIAQLGESEGVLEEDESRVISNLVNLKNVKIREVMTPRTVVLAIPQTMKIHEFFESDDFKKHSRIPVYKDDADNISGYILKIDVMAKIAEGKTKIQVSSIRRNAIVVYENFSIPVLFKKLMDAHEHIAIVVDEYGVFAGVVTMEDVMETMLGQEILDENDAQADLQQTARDKWKERSKGLNFNGHESGEDEKNSE